MLPHRLSHTLRLLISEKASDILIMTAWYFCTILCTSKNNIHASSTEIWEKRNSFQMKWKRKKRFKLLQKESWLNTWETLLKWINLKMAYYIFFLPTENVRYVTVSADTRKPGVKINSHWKDPPHLPKRKSKGLGYFWFSFSGRSLYNESKSSSLFLFFFSLWLLRDLFLPQLHKYFNYLFPQQSFREALPPSPLFLDEDIEVKWFSQGYKET